MNKTILVAFVFVATAAIVNGHGRIVKPVHRGGAWRDYPNDFPEAIDIEWCGYETEAQEQNYLNVNPTDIRNVTCGICGPIYNNNPTVGTVIFKPNVNGGTYSTVYSFEKSSPIYRGYIVETYNQSQVVDINLRVSITYIIINYESIEKLFQNIDKTWYV